MPGTVPESRVCVQRPRQKQFGTIKCPGIGSTPTASFSMCIGMKLTLPNMHKLFSFVLSIQHQTALVGGCLWRIYGLMLETEAVLVSWSLNYKWSRTMLWTIRLLSERRSAAMCKRCWQIGLRCQNLKLNALCCTNAWHHVVCSVNCEICERMCSMLPGCFAVIHTTLP